MRSLSPRAISGRRWSLWCCFFLLFSFLGGCSALEDLLKRGKPAPAPEPTPAETPLPSETPVPAPVPPVTGAGPLIGYSLPNWWHRIDARALAAELDANGLNLTGIEYIPWWTETGCGCKFDGGCSSLPFPADYARFVGEMRKKGITTFVNLVNWNHCVIRRTGDQWFRDRLAEIMAVGPELVILSPVSEPWVASSAVPQRWAGTARSGWAGLFALPDRGRNSATGQPYFGGIGHQFLDVHPCNDAALLASLRKGNPRILTNSDCTGTLNPGPERAARWVTVAAEKRANLLVYGFRDRQMDVAVIGAMGAALR